MNKSAQAFTFAFGFASSAILFSVVQALSTTGPAAPKPLVVTKTEYKTETIYRNVPVEHIIYQKSPAQLITQVEYVNVPSVCPRTNAPAGAAPLAPLAIPLAKQEAAPREKNLVYGLVGTRETFGDLTITNTTNEYSAVLPKKNEMEVGLGFMHDFSNYSLGFQGTQNSFALTFGVRF